MSLIFASEMDGGGGDGVNLINFQLFDTLLDQRDIAALEDAKALERVAREALDRRDAIVRRLTRNISETGPRSVALSAAPLQLVCGDD